MATGTATDMCTNTSNGNQQQPTTATNNYNHQQSTWATLAAAAAQ